MRQSTNTPGDDRDKAIRRRLVTILALLASTAAGLLAISLTAVDATQYVLVLRFGRVVRVIETPGLALVTPFDRVLRLDRRLLFFSPPPSEFLTLDKKNVVAQPIVAWRIVLPERFFASVGNRANAEARLADIVFAEIGSVLGRYPFAALVSTDAKPNAEQAPMAEIGIRVAAAARPDYGIEIAEIGLQQISLPEQNRQSVFERMKAERGRLAKRYRSEGELEAKRIIAEADRQKVRLATEAYEDAQRVRGDGDAAAARIYASAYNQDPSFYRFLRTLQAYALILDENTTVVLPSSAEALAVLHEQAQRLAPATPAPPRQPGAQIGSVSSDPVAALPKIVIAPYPSNEGGR